MNARYGFFMTVHIGGILKKLAAGSREIATDSNLQAIVVAVILSEIGRSNPPFCWMASKSFLSAPCCCGHWDEPERLFIG
jgi:hypothetical protein